LNVLGSICGVTIVVPDLEPIESAYTRYLGMRVVSRGKVAPAQAQAWGAPECAGCDTLTLAPEVGEQTSMRFIADPAAGRAVPFTTFGWNATEITVRDTDALAASLAGSPFTIIGPPANLKGWESIRAMQVLGPAGECLYLTDVRAESSLAQAHSAVGQVFIVVAAGGDFEALSAFYKAHFENEVSAAVEIPIGVISTANHLPAETLYKLGLVTLPGGTRIELDEYPSTAGPRPTVAGHLPPGMAIVSFRSEGLPGVSCIRGGAGEIIELCGPLSDTVVA
jgi:catechol 2,3-dioxygenase-like lactoylglutathione lyase family enzyme